MMHKKNQGYTLVELLVGITVGALVTLAATTVILMGLRLNRQSMDTTGKQNTARVLLTAMENLATDGSITSVKMDYEDWQIIGDNDTIIYSYDAENRVIYTGDTTGTPFMKNVLSSYLEYEDGLLTLSVETEKGIFNSTVYCRQEIVASGNSGSNKEEDIVPDNESDQVAPPSITDDELDTKIARTEFLKTVVSQYRMCEVNGDQKNVKPNPGWILEPIPENEPGAGLYEPTYKYYSQWYISSQGDKGVEAWENGTWNPDTPWCACFVTWGIHNSGDILRYKASGADGPENYKIYPSHAGVDSFKEFFTKDTADNEEWITAKFWNEYAPDPKPGDIIFLDWVVNLVFDPQHVGVVLRVENGYVYTIEGNVSGKTFDSEVGLRRYKLDDPRILGYGVLDWKTDAELASD